MSFKKGHIVTKETRKKISENHKGMLGKHHSIETKIKMSKSHRGRIQSEEHREKNREGHKGQIPWNKGKKMSEEYIIKCRIRQLKMNWKGENHPNWRGGKSSYGMEFNAKLKEYIRKRDNYRCRECGINQNKLYRKLVVHHLDYDKQNNNHNNFISLCNSCHMKTNFNRDKWISHFEEGARF